MKTVLLTAAAVFALGLAACDNTREAEATTGTATAEVETDAPNSVISDAELQAEAQKAATAASMPVDGSNLETMPAPK
jgi:hypothetical protein